MDNIRDMSSASEDMNGADWIQQEQCLAQQWQEEQACQHLSPLIGEHDGN
jgi:hypothetical protein